MKTKGALFLIIGIAILIGTIVCLFLSASPVYIGLGLVVSVVCNTIGGIMLTAKK